MHCLPRFLPLLALGFSAAALADDPQVYKWTDAQGTLHYSDQPPAQPAPDLIASDMPSFPAVDAVELAQQQAALLAQVTALQRLSQAELDRQAQAAALAREQEELQAELQDQQAAQAQSAPAEPIYVSSAFVPRAYRANLYLPAGRRVSAPHPHAASPLHVRSPGSLPLKP